MIRTIKIQHMIKNIDNNNYSNNQQQIKSIVPEIRLIKVAALLLGKLGRVVPNDEVHQILLRDGGGVLSRLVNKEFGSVLRNSNGIGRVRDGLHVHVCVCVCVGVCECVSVCFIMEKGRKKCVCVCVCLKKYMRVCLSVCV